MKNISEPVVMPPQVSMSPDEFIRYYMKVFNTESNDALEGIFHFPHTKIGDGKMTIFPSKDTPIMDYEGIRKSGWKYTKVYDAKVISESANSALVELDSGRFDKDDREFIRSKFYYVLTKEFNYWKILTIISIAKIAGIK